MPSNAVRLAKYTLTYCIACLLVAAVNPAPMQYEETPEPEPVAQSSRGGKSLPGFYDYLPQDDYAPDLDSDYGTLEDTENEVLSRANYNKRHNSPIYYIRLPPSPYVFVPGLGYVSRPPSVAPLGPTTNSFINLPISFVANGKPSNIYQWSAGFPPAPPPRPTPVPVPVTPAPKPTRKPDSTIHRIPGRFPFNGKPTDIFVLRDSYNSLYADSLQNFYP